VVHGLFADRCLHFSFIDRFILGLLVALIYGVPVLLTMHRALASYREKLDELA